MLNIWDAFWDLRIAECPCDEHFCEWLEANNHRQQAIFHFGTGGHHIVGLHNLRQKLDNAIVAITASPSEYESYVKMVIEMPMLGWGYKPYFGDIYQLNARALPQFDIVSLFHLCEFRSEKNDSYGGLTDETMLKLLADRTREGGHILFYEESFAFHLAKPIIEKIAAEGLIEPVGRYKTLPIYRRTRKAV